MFQALDKKSIVIIGPLLFLFLLFLVHSSRDRYLTNISNENLSSTYSPAIASFEDSSTHQQHDNEDNDDYDNKNVDYDEEVNSHSSEQKGPDYLNAFLSSLNNNGPFPIIIGGIGDSGTRGVRQVLRDFGVQMLAEPFVNGQGDSLIYEKRFTVFDPKSNTWSERTSRMLYKQGIHRSRTLRYNQSFSSLWHEIANCAGLPLESNTPLKRN